MLSQVMQAHKISFTTQCEHKNVRKIENENVAIFNVVVYIARFDRLRKIHKLKFNHATTVLIIAF